MEQRDTFRMDPVRLGALVGGIFTFFVVGAIIDVLWVAIGAVIGGGLGWLVRRYGRDLRTYADATEMAESASREELYAEAQRLDIPGRSSMTRDELAQAVASRRAA